MKLLLYCCFCYILWAADADDPLEVEDNDTSSCEESMFGCCPNSTLPSHGPHGEGCCLMEDDGCCPDHLQIHDNMCHCDQSPLGCCPDGVTSRWSLEEDGCGCQHTTFGCCQDQYTTASGKLISIITQVKDILTQVLTTKVVHVGPPYLVVVQMELPQLLDQMVKVVRTYMRKMMDLVKRKLATAQSQSINVVLMESNQQKVQTFKDVSNIQEMCAV